MKIVPQQFPQTASPALSAAPVTPAAQLFENLLNQAQPIDRMDLRNAFGFAELGPFARTLTGAEKPQPTHSGAPRLDQIRLQRNRLQTPHAAPIVVGGLPASAISFEMDDGQTPQPTLEGSGEQALSITHNGVASTHPGASARLLAFGAADTKAEPVDDGRGQPQLAEDQTTPDGELNLTLFQQGDEVQVVIAAPGLSAESLVGLRRLADLALREVGSSLSSISLNGADLDAPAMPRIGGQNGNRAR